MRVAILSDIHGNRTAFETVLTDLQQTSPDLILHASDLADASASPVKIVGRIRNLGRPGIVGNTDESIFRPESLEEFANQSSPTASLWTAILGRWERIVEAIGSVMYVKPGESAS